MDTSAVAGFSGWIAHRASLLQMRTPEELCQISGIPLSTFARILATGSLSGVDRSARAWLARALKVPLRELEAFADGRQTTIPDTRQVDLDLPPAAAGRDERQSSISPPALQAAPGRGVPVVASLLNAGVIHFFAVAAQPECSRLPVRFAGYPDAFAITVEDDSARALIRSRFLIFCNIAPPRLATRHPALFTFTDGSPAGHTLLGSLTHLDGDSRIVGWPGEDMLLPIPPLDTLVRVARLIARRQT